VFKLQGFLDGTQDEHLATSGIYDSTTMLAVGRFQMRYGSDILLPWGLRKPTFTVYTTTLRKINTLACSGSKPFALTPLQGQILASITAGKVNHTSVPKVTATGSVPPKVVVPAFMPIVTQTLGVPPASAPAHVQPVKENTKKSGWLSTFFGVLGR
jgi:hypothetical protein